jgi:hypothetical protein
VHLAFQGRTWHLQVHLQFSRAHRALSRCTCSPPVHPVNGRCALFQISGTWGSPGAPGIARCAWHLQVHLPDAYVISQGAPERQILNHWCAAKGLRLRQCISVCVVVGAARSRSRVFACILYLVSSFNSFISVFVCVFTAYCRAYRGALCFNYLENKAVEIMPRWGDIGDWWRPFHRRGQPLF